MKKLFFFLGGAGIFCILYLMIILALAGEGIVWARTIMNFVAENEDACAGLILLALFLGGVGLVLE